MLTINFDFKDSSIAKKCEAQSVPWGGRERGDGMENSARSPSDVCSGE